MKLIEKERNIRLDMECSMVRERHGISDYCNAMFSKE